jgi:DNA-directed RNA polymerase subunit RPC12/RpoP
MSSLHHTCGECSSEFTIKYDEHECESDPLHCPFCGEYILDMDKVEDEDE